MNGSQRTMGHPASHEWFCKDHGRVTHYIMNGSERTMEGWPSTSWLNSSKLSHHHPPLFDAQLAEVSQCEWKEWRHQVLNARTGILQYTHDKALHMTRRMGGGEKTLARRDTCPQSQSHKLIGKLRILKWLPSRRIWDPWSKLQRFCGTYSLQVVWNPFCHSEKALNNFYFVCLFCFVWDRVSLCV